MRLFSNDLVFLKFLNDRGLKKILLVLLFFCSCSKEQQNSLVRGVDEVDTQTPRHPMPIPSPPTGQDEIPIPKIEKLRWYPNNIWKKSWSNSVVDKVIEVGLSQQEVDIDDLADLECLGYSNASEREKAIFWLVMIASVASQESAFDPENRYYERSLGEWSEGLMQLSISDQSRGQICRQLDSNSILDPNTNLGCAVIILQDQLKGSRTRVDNQLFPISTYYWSTLTIEGTKSQVISFFKKHLNQLRFCSGA